VALHVEVISNRPPLLFLISPFTVLILNQASIFIFIPTYCWFWRKHFTHHNFLLARGTLWIFEVRMNKDKQVRNMGLRLLSIINVCLERNLDNPPASERSGEFRKINRLVVFSGCPSIHDFYIWFGVINFKIYLLPQFLSYWEYF